MPWQCTLPVQLEAYRHLLCPETMELVSELAAYGHSNAIYMFLMHNTDRTVHNESPLSIVHDESSDDRPVFHVRN